MLEKINNTFLKTTFLQNPHIQTIYPTFFAKSKPFSIEIETFELTDGDFVDCYWYDKPKQNTKQPITILFHGLAGSFHSPYIQKIMYALNQVNFSVVLMHFRGCSPRANRLPRSYHSGDTEDAKAWINHVHQTYPQSQLFAIGYSLGGNMLLKLLGEYKDKSPLHAAVAVSAPMQLEICSDKMNSGISKLYQYHLLQHLKKDLLRKYIDHDMKSFIALTQDEVSQLKSFRAFDDAYTAPIHGFKNAKDYYQKCSALSYLKDITTPVRIIHALDDPFMTPEVLPTKDQYSENITLSIHKHGGHVGFIGGSCFSPIFLLQEEIINYLYETL